MTNIVEPREAVLEDDTVTSFGAGELTALVRRWMAAGAQVEDRAHHDRALRIAPDPDVLAHDRSTSPSPDSVDVAADGVEAAAVDHVSHAWTLPRCATQAPPGRVNRVALLVDARRVPADVAARLVARLTERGAVHMCRVYADWTRRDVAVWAEHMPSEGLHSFHHFPDDGEQGLVAMTIDALDLARSAAVDEVAMAGDLTAALPLVHRLHAAGVRVVAVGSAHTPADVRAAADEFSDLGLLGPAPLVSVGRHRA